MTYMKYFSPKQENKFLTFMNTKQYKLKSTHPQEIVRKLIVSQKLLLAHQLQADAEVEQSWT